MIQTIVSQLTPVHLAAILVAILLAATRLAPLTKPWWDWLPKKAQSLLPGLVAGIPIAITAFQNVKSWMDFIQSVLVVAAFPTAMALPGASSPHNHPDQMAAYLEKKDADKPTLPPMVGGMVLSLLCIIISMGGCAAALSVLKPIDQAAVLLCADFYQKKNPTLSLQDVEKSFCSAANDIAPFLAQAKKAEARAGVELELDAGAVK